ncbi:hypothetical protein FHX08_004525 [Rhizobium sp. BK529]|uniref:DUF2934 domain-containing protein n=1 Tax=unclassified Rhizobium TaxID=2613769 RepID=UPI0010438674|nr:MULTISPECIES: DUF2934 domain-containing protein [unclassified Rhizobium]MBB3594122.1 hypothetical protein [Rhizobium sp. BK529]TCS01577.1 DUF2934 family protein [Rhizobium sp. BK418]
MAEAREEWIKKRAYALWEEEGHPTGRDSIHWEQARAEHDALKGASKSANGKEVKPRAKRAAAAKTAESTNGGEAKAKAKRTATSTKAGGIVKPAPKRTVARKSAS